jgi:hypothetical protein
MVASLFLASQAGAERRGTTSHSSHGDRAYNDALRFAQQNNLGHFTVNSNGTRRIVVNVPSNKITEWCNTFSKGNCYIEPFFNTTPNRYAPSWSMLRMGDKYYRQYGQGSEYRASTYGGRTAFPVSLTRQELDSTVNAVHNSPNGRWNYNGGNPESTGRNCTNWLTYKVGQFTGVRTASVKHHMSALTRGYHSPRMSVMAIMSSEPIQNFGQDQLQTNWH